ncbi:MAG TPA: ABC transporter permease [Terriglobales bacterium]|nr:ABC transporter permease [Terriglobales bacterium]
MVFEGMAAMADTRANLTGNGNPEQVVVQNVTAGFFRVVRVNPVLGAGFTEENWKKGSDDVVILDYGFWKERFGGDPYLIGKTIDIDGKPHVVVGVAPKDFTLYVKDGSLTGAKPQMWAPWAVPQSFGDRKQGIGRYLTVVARMKPGVKLPQAQDQMNTVATRLQQQYPDTNTHWGATVVSIREQLSGDLRPALVTLFCAVAFVLLIACANVSSLLLARAAKREREIAIRTAIGASRWRVARQLLTESLLLAIIGGALGLLFAVWGTNALLAASPKGLLGLNSVSVDGKLLSFAAAATLLSSLLFGFLPSYVASHSPIAETLKEETRSSASARRGVVRHALVVGQMGLALVLLAGSGLLIRSFIRLAGVNPGFESRNLLTFQVALPRTKYAKDELQVVFFNEFLNRISRIPGVRSVTMENYPPLTGLGAATGVHILGQPQLSKSEGPVSGVRVVGPDYFHTMGIPILAGRTFNDAELHQTRRVVIVNQAFVDKHLPGENPLGKRVVIYMRDEKVDDENPSEIIGVCGSVRQMSPGEEPKPNAYWPMPELPYSRMTVLTRTSNDPLSLVPPIRRELRQMDSELPMASIASMDQLLADSLSRSRFMMFVLGVFAAIALVLTVVGIYGVIAYSVAQRTHEIGIRMALGAQRRNVLSLVLGEGTRLTLIGVGIGIVAAVALTRLMGSLLYGISSTDPLTFAAVILTLAAVAFLATFVPARHATRVSPVVALRYE